MTNSLMQHVHVIIQIACNLQNYQHLFYLHENKSTSGCMQTI